MAVMTTIRKPETLSVRDLLADQDLTRDDLKLIFDLGAGESHAQRVFAGAGR